MQKYQILRIFKDAAQIIDRSGKQRLINLKGIHTIKDINGGTEITPYIHRDKKLYLITDSMILHNFNNAKLDIVNKANDVTSATYLIQNGSLSNKPIAVSHAEQDIKMPHNAAEKAPRAQGAPSSMLILGTKWRNQTLSKPNIYSQSDFPSLGAKPEYMAKKKEVLFTEEDFPSLAESLSKTPSTPPSTPKMSKEQRIIAQGENAKKELAPILKDQQEGFTLVTDKATMQYIAQLQEYASRGEVMQLSSGQALPGQGKRARKKQERILAHPRKEEYRKGPGLEQKTIILL
jgi:hypothetical protein